MQLQLQPKETSLLLKTDILFQSVYWSRVKSNLGLEPLAFDYRTTSGLKGDILILIRHFRDGISGAYVPQGPEYGPVPEKYGLFLEKLSQALSAHLRPAVAFIQYDLPWESPYVRGDDGKSQ